MVLDDMRDKAKPYLDPLAEEMGDTHPNTVTWISFAFAVGGALAFGATSLPSAAGWALVLLFVGGLAVGISALLDALDGQLARLRGIAGKRGDFLDHVLDRYADAIIIAGITLSAFVLTPYGPWLGLSAALGVIFSSYMGTQAAALGLGRNYKGILGRADRLVLLLVFTLAQLLWTLVTGSPAILPPVPEIGFPQGISIMELLLLVFAVGGHITAGQRAWTTWIGLTLRELAPDTTDVELARMKVAEAKATVRSAKRDLRLVKLAQKVATKEARAEVRRIRTARKHLEKAARLGTGERPPAREAPSKDDASVYSSRLKALKAEITRREATLAAEQSHLADLCSQVDQETVRSEVEDSTKDSTTSEAGKEPDGSPAVRPKAGR